LFSGPPGTGKTLLASRLPGLLPPLAENEALEVAAIQSVVSCSPLSHWPQRPFRQPHHSASGPALVGGGSKPQPGEITLAHHGVLFLDELPEFDRKVLEVLREPLESGHIVISRAKDRVRFPARFQLVAVMKCNLGLCTYRLSTAILLKFMTFFSIARIFTLGSGMKDVKKRFDRIFRTENKIRESKGRQQHAGCWSMVTSFHCSPRNRGTCT
jgi:Mg-chelatase subunit ChlI